MEHLLFYGKNCIVSHAEPMRAFSKQELIDGRLYPGVVQGLTWTDNGEAANESVNKTIKNLTGYDDTENYVWLGGHRPVTENFRVRQNGMYIQIHNPSRQNIALVQPDKKFNPETDIRELKK